MSKKLLFVTLGLFSFVAVASGDPGRCKRQADNEAVVHSDDYKRKYTLTEMGEAFAKFYESGLRLKGRAYYDESLRSYVLPLDRGQAGAVVKINEKFIRSVTRHIEISLERRYADFVFFPDMGHSHLHLPKEDYAKLKAVEPTHKMYEGFFAYPKLKMLYHTAEKLEVRPGEYNEGPFPQDPVVLWRYFSRNPVGDNNGGEEVFVLFQQEEPAKYNTVKHVPGHEEYSSGYYINASKSACFPYRHQGKTFYFDISLESLPCRDCEGY